MPDQHPLPPNVRLCVCVCACARARLCVFVLGIIPRYVQVSYILRLNYAFSFKCIIIIIIVIIIIKIMYYFSSKLRRVNIVHILPQH